MTTMTRPGRESERTCIGCRRRAPTGALARVALASSSAGTELVFWGKGRARPVGRGASLHANAACLRAALKTGAFGRAFRGQVGAVGSAGSSVDEAELLKQLTAAMTALAKVEDRKTQ